jgi:hypothetical protein
MRQTSSRSANEVELERDGMLPRSRSVGSRLTLASTMRYHSIHNERGRWYLCGCAPGIRGITNFSELRRNARRYYRWAAF